MSKLDCTGAECLSEIEICYFYSSELVPIQYTLIEKEQIFGFTSN